MRIVADVESLVVTSSDKLISACIESLLNNGHSDAGQALERWSVPLQLLSRLIPARWFFAALPPVRWLADRPPGALQPWVGPIYSLVQRHNELLGIASV